MHQYIGKYDTLGVIHVLRGWVVSIFRKKRYEGVRFNVISVTREWVGVQFPEKKVLRNIWMAPYW